MADHKLLWQRVLAALAARAALPSGYATEQEIAARAKDLMGTDLVHRFLEEYYLEREYDGGSGRISDGEAERLVTALESLAAAGRAKKPKAADPSDRVRPLNPGGFVSRPPDAFIEAVPYGEDEAEAGERSRQEAQKAAAEAERQAAADRRRVAIERERAAREAAIAKRRQRKAAKHEERRKAKAEARQRVRAAISELYPLRVQTENQPRAAAKEPDSARHGVGNAGQQRPYSAVHQHSQEFEARPPQSKTKAKSPAAVVAPAYDPRPGYFYILWTSGWVVSLQDLEVIRLHPYFHEREITIHYTITILILLLSLVALGRYAAKHNVLFMRIFYLPSFTLADIAEILDFIRAPKWFIILFFPVYLFFLYAGLILSLVALYILFVVAIFPMAVILACPIMYFLAWQDSTRDAIESATENQWMQITTIMSLVLVPISWAIGRRFRKKTSHRL